MLQKFTSKEQTFKGNEGGSGEVNMIESKHFERIRTNSEDFPNVHFEDVNLQSETLSRNTTQTNSKEKLITLQRLDSQRDSFKSSKRVAEFLRKVEKSKSRSKEKLFGGEGRLRQGSRKLNFLDLKNSKAGVSKRFSFSPRNREQQNKIFNTFSKIRTNKHAADKHITFRADDDQKATIFSSSGQNTQPAKNNFIDIKNVGTIEEKNLISITKKYLKKSVDANSPKSSVPTLKFENVAVLSQTSSSNKYSSKITKIQRIEGRSTIGASYTSSRKGSRDFLNLHHSQNLNLTSSNRMETSSTMKDFTLENNQQMLQQINSHSNFHNSTDRDGLTSFDNSTINFSNSQFAESKETRIEDLTPPGGRHMTQSNEMWEINDKNEYRISNHATESGQQGEDFGYLHKKQPNFAFSNQREIGGTPRYSVKTKLHSQQSGEHQVADEEEFERRLSLRNIKDKMLKKKGQISEFKKNKPLKLSKTRKSPKANMFSKRKQNVKNILNSKYSKTRDNLYSAKSSRRSPNKLINWLKSRSKTPNQKRIDLVSKHSKPLFETEDLTSKSRAVEIDFAAFGKSSPRNRRKNDKVKDMNHLKITRKKSREHTPILQQILDESVPVLERSPDFGSKKQNRQFKRMSLAYTANSSGNRTPIRFSLRTSPLNKGNLNVRTPIRNKITNPPNFSKVQDVLQKGGRSPFPRLYKQDLPYQNMEYFNNENQISHEAIPQFTNMKKSSFSGQTELNDREINNILEDNHQLAQKLGQAHEQIHLLGEENRKLAILRQYYPKSDQLILEEGEPVSSSHNFEQNDLESLNNFIPINHPAQEEQNSSNHPNFTYDRNESNKSLTRNGKTLVHSSGNILQSSEQKQTSIDWNGEGMEEENKDSSNNLISRVNINNPHMDFFNENNAIIEEVENEQSFISTNRSHFAAGNCGVENTGSSLDDLDDEDFHLNNNSRSSKSPKKVQKVPILPKLQNLNTENISLGPMTPHAVNHQMRSSRTPHTPSTPIDLLRGSNFHSLVKSEHPSNAKIENKMQDFVNYLDENVQNEEVSSFAKYTLGFFSQSLLSLNAQIDTLKCKEEKNTLDKKMKFKEMELNMKEQELSVKTKDARIKELQTEMKLQSYDLLVENKNLIKENSELKQKMAEMARKIDQLALNQSNGGNTYSQNSNSPPNQYFTVSINSNSVPQQINGNHMRNIARNFNQPVGDVEGEGSCKGSHVEYIQPQEEFVTENKNGSSQEASEEEEGSSEVVRSRKKNRAEVRTK